MQRIKANEGSTVRRVKTPSQNSLSGGITKRTSCSNETHFWFAASRDISVSMLHSENVAYHAATTVEIMTELKFRILAYNCEWFYGEFTYLESHRARLLPTWLLYINVISS